LRKKWDHDLAIWAQSGTSAKELGKNVGVVSAISGTGSLNLSDGATFLSLLSRAATATINNLSSANGGDAAAQERYARGIYLYPQRYGNKKWSGE
jgi:hypothetical protein